MAFQQSLQIATRGRGTFEITEAVAEIVARAGIACGLVHVFVQHTSCSVMLTENADPSVRHDLETLAYRHADEGDDDMAAHGRTLLAGSFVTVPVTDGRLALGTWQGIYLWEHRALPHRRHLVVTICG